MDWLRLVVLTLFFAALQGSLIAVVPWAWARPDLLLAFLVVTAMSRGPSVGTWLGFALGVVRDLSDPGLLGLRALSLALVGFASGRFAENVDRTSRVVQGLAILVMGITARLLDTVLVAILEGTPTWIRFLSTDVPSVVLTAVVIPAALGTLGLMKVRRRS